MSDNLGELNSAHRVLDSTNRSFESVIYQYQKPPLSSEVNLNGSIDSVRTQGIVDALAPSGWLSVGQITDSSSPSSFQCGDVLCSFDSSANTVRLVAQDFGQNTEKNIAMVNGWKINVQGSSSPNSGVYNPNATTDEDCLITLPTPPVTGNRTDFVFLEVWRKLITPDDNIYKYGNVDYYGSVYPNDLIDPARGFETSLRVQVQYRLRVSEVSSSNLKIYPEGFSPTVYAQGPLSTPSTCSDSTFSPVSGNQGLWVAGMDDPLAQEKFETVDGLVYAIPMFAVHRRSTQAFNPNGSSNGALYSLADYNAGTLSDRPDNLYNDSIVADDIVDLRHKILTNKSLDTVCADAFKDLQANTLKTKMGYKEVGENSIGPVLMNVDYIAPSTHPSKDWANYVGDSNNLDGTNVLGRRWFSNAGGKENVACIKTINDKSTGTNGSAWVAGDTFSINLSDLGYPTGTMITRIHQVIYTVTDPVSSLIVYGSSYGYTVSPTTTGSGFSWENSTNSIEVTLESAFVSTSDSLRVSFEITYPSGLGLTDVPVKFLEVRKGDPATSFYYPENHPIAMKDQDIPVRYGSAATPVGTSDGTFNNMLRARGGNYCHAYDFGHQMIYHIAGNGTNTVTFDRSISDYNIIGLADLKVDGVTQGYTAITRTSSTYTITLSAVVSSGKNIELTLYTDEKYFEGNKQGRAIIDCYQMTELRTLETPNGTDTTFTLDTGNKPILNLGSYADKGGVGYGYVNNEIKPLLNNNSYFPKDVTSTDIINNYDYHSLYSVCTVGFVDPPAADSTVYIPALINSAPDSTDVYYFFYNSIPYQGLGDTTDFQETGSTWPNQVALWPVTGSIETVGPSITTSAGSGAITDYTYAGGYVILDGGVTVTADSDYDLPSWVGNARPGYLFSMEDFPLNKFLIKTVVNDSTLILDSSAAYPVVFGTVQPQIGVVTAPDQPDFTLPNIMDRMPTSYIATDASGLNTKLTTAVSDGDQVLETRIVSRTQDMVGTINTAQIGVSEASRGKSQVLIDSAPLGEGSLGLKFENLASSDQYKKTYQSYILNKDNSGKLYLMVVGSETDNTGTNKCYMNAFSTEDVVDIFNIPGRPLLANRTE